MFVELIYKMQRLEVSGAVRPIYGSLGVKRLTGAVARRLGQIPSSTTDKVETAVAVLQIGRSLVRSQLVSWEFFIDIKSFRPHYGVDSASKQKWVPWLFPGGKGGRCLKLTTLPPSSAVVMKSGNLNFLEPSGPIQDCNGTDLPLPQIRWGQFGRSLVRSQLVSVDFSLT